ncbi:unnamed protein product [Agarophyton chilense]|eukprot:gb/GEZJ01003677.1/.p1 GENE.gb/GEZJ01003677.1/~~gb/GEZJ01003677.1/.p1  ORF type:complete len:221 (-),score=26.18 gb/GEZJ01003677.1/:775-1437(-)
MLGLRAVSSIFTSNLPRLAPCPVVLRQLTTVPTPPTAQHPTTQSPAPLPVDAIDTDAAAPEYRTQRKAVYRLPFYGASDAAFDRLSEHQVRTALRAYGGLIRPRDDLQTLFHRLKRLANAAYRPKQLTIEGVVVSNKMRKSVVIAAKRLCFSSKLQKSYYKTRRFMAHDELNLCREGDRVVIRSCRLMSKRKSHVVVLNFGDPTRPGLDQRSIQLENIPA